MKAFHPDLRSASDAFTILLSPILLFFPLQFLPSKQLSPLFPDCRVYLRLSDRLAALEGLTLLTQNHINISRKAQLKTKLLHKASRMPISCPAGALPRFVPFSIPNFPAYAPAVIAEKNATRIGA